MRELAAKLSTKQRLLKVREILERYTDEENQLTIREIIDLLDSDQPIGVHTVRDDIKELEESGLFDVIEQQEKNGLEKYYSHQNRLFELHELRVLVDAVSAARFITKNDSEKLIEKLKKLTSDHLAKQLENRILLIDGVKTENSHVKYAIHTLHGAICKRQVVRFQYGKYNLDKQFQLRRDGGFYYVKPLGLIWNFNFYYLIGQYEPDGDIRHYRVDRMRNVTALERTFLPDPGFDISKYTSKLFHMYSGEERNVEIEFDNHLINVVIDRFGLNVPITRHTENTFRISTPAVISDGLVRWLLTWGADAKVLNPPELVKRIKEETEKMRKQYE